MNITTFHLLLLLVLSPSLLQHANAQQPSDSTSSDDYSLNTEKVSPSMAVIVIVLVIGFFITGCVTIYIQQCADSSSSSAASLIVVADDGRSRLENKIRGLDRSVIDTFPMFLYSEVKELKLGKGSLECAICLSEFGEDETLRFVPKCDHVFHPDCIDAWLLDHATCPVCRANLVPDAIPVQSGNPTVPTQVADSDREPESSPAEVQITIAGEGSASEEVTSQTRKFRRSHSTGHSLVRPGEDCERYTLRLPAEVRRQLVARQKLKRATSLVALPRASSSRRGYRSGGEGSGSSRYSRILGRATERWPFTVALTPFIARMGSFRSTKVGADGDLTANRGSKKFFGTVVSPLESSPPQVPV